MLLVASTFIGSAYVLSEKAHVSMEWIYDFLSKKNIIRLKIFTSLLSLAFFLILFYFGFLMPLRRSYQYNNYELMPKQQT